MIREEHKRASVVVVVVKTKICIAQRISEAESFFSSFSSFYGKSPVVSAWYTTVVLMIVITIQQWKSYHGMAFQRVKNSSR